MGGLTGMATGFALQYWASAIEYPMNVGGRPYATWPAFVIPSYELTILFSSLTAAIGMFALNGLPQPYHPVFNVERFSMASSDKFFLVIESADPRFDHAGDDPVPAGAGREGSVRRCGVTLLVAVVLAARSARGRLPAGHARRPALRGRTRPARSSPTAAPPGRRPPARWRAAGCARTRRSTPAGPNGELRRASSRSRSAADMARGRERYNIYCTPCHGILGDGQGMVVQRGLRRAASYHQDRLRDEKVGYFYDVVTNGFGAMQGYAEQIPVRDRWLIVGLRPRAAAQPARDDGRGAGGSAGPLDAAPGGPEAATAAPR